MGKNLDSELAEAAGLGGAGPEEAANMAVPQPAESAPEREAPKRRKKTNTGLLVMLLLMVGGIVSLFAFGFKEASIYSMPVADFMAQKEQHAGRRVRIEGELVPGTLVRRDKPCEYRFRLRGGGQELEIRYPQCVVPDTFRDMPQGGVEVTAEGELKEAGYFEASTILAKCSSKYDPETHLMDDGRSAQK
jgi:cytochrome c-type biogenesis protein CcmE